MSKLRSSLLLTAALAVSLTPATRAEWIHLTDSLFQAERSGQRHPAGVTRRIVMPSDAEEGAAVCVLYDNSMAQKNKGKVRGNVEIARADGSVERLAINGRVRNNSFSKCRETGALAAGDVLTFDFTFRNLPRLQRTRSRTDFASVSGAVATGTDELPEAPGAGPLSVEDQEAVARLKGWPRSGRGVALRFETNGVWIDWRTAPGVGGQTGPYRTIEAAVNAFFGIIN